MIVGNELGQVGVGVGKADDVLNAIQFLYLSRH
jgi:ribosomal protein S5